jgi:hypothetical protein
LPDCSHALNGIFLASRKLSLNCVTDNGFMLQPIITLRCDSNTHSLASHIIILILFPHSQQDHRHFQTAAKMKSNMI